MFGGKHISINGEIAWGQQGLCSGIPAVRMTLLGCGTKHSTRSLAEKPVCVWRIAAVFMQVKWHTFNASLSRPTHRLPWHITSPWSKPEDWLSDFFQIFGWKKTEVENKPIKTQCGDELVNIYVDIEVKNSTLLYFQPIRNLTQRITFWTKYEFNISARNYFCQREHHPKCHLPDSFSLKIYLACIYSMANRFRRALTVDIIR